MPKQKINQLCKCQTIIVSIICRSTHTDFGMLHNPLWPIEGSHRQKLNRDVLELTDVLNQMALTNIYILEYLYTQKNIHAFSTSWKFFQHLHHTQTKSKL